MLPRAAENSKTISPNNEWSEMEELSDSVAVWVKSKGVMSQWLDRTDERFMVGEKVTTLTINSCCE